jgi:reverse gyrase
MRVKYCEFCKECVGEYIADLIDDVGVCKNCLINQKRIKQIAKLKESNAKKRGEIEKLKARLVQFSAIVDSELGVKR